MLRLAYFRVPVVRIPTQVCLNTSDKTPVAAYQVPGTVQFRYQVVCSQENNCIIRSTPYQGSR